MLEHAFRLGLDLVYREQLDFLTKLKWPSLTYENVPWALHTPRCTLQNWSLAGLLPDSLSSSAVMVGQVTNNVDTDLDRRSVTSWDVESAREDGELPTTLPVATLPVDSPVAVSSEQPPHFEHSRSLALISKNVTPSKMVKTHSFSKYDDDLELVLDSESDTEMQVDEQNDNKESVVTKPWEDYAAREFDFVLSRIYGNDRIIKLNAKVKYNFSSFPLLLAVYFT